MRILCVCLGNICRSPMAEGAIRKMAREAGLKLVVDSAGTGRWHLGQPPHPEGIAVASRRGYDNSDQRARQIEPGDFERFDLILAMDKANLATLRRIAPPSARAEMRLFHPKGQEIPDPYGEGREAYEATLDLVEESALALVDRLAADRSLP